MKKPEKTYYELAAPFETREAMDKAVGAFMDDVKALRLKHRIADVFVCAQTYASAANDRSGEFLTSSHYGRQQNALVMLAQTLGQWRSKFHERLNDLRNPENF